MPKDPSHDEFFYPRYPYRGEIKPENMVFNANLQEFAQRVNYICNLETSGKIKPEEAYKQIKEIWKQLKSSKKELRIGEDMFKEDDDEDPPAS